MFNRAIKGAAMNAECAVRNQKRRLVFVFGVIMAMIVLMMAMTACSSTSSSSTTSKASSSAASSVSATSTSTTSASSKASSSATSSVSSSTASTKTVESFDPGKEYKQGDMAQFSGYSLGGEATVDQKTGKKGAIIFFSTDANASTDDAQAIILLDTVRATSAGTEVKCTAVCATVGDDGVPIFSEM